jgi:hypothetical protein
MHEKKKGMSSLQWKFGSLSRRLFASRVDLHFTKF